MCKTVVFLLAAALAFGADDPWAKVKELKTGTELQVYRRSSAQPMSVKMDELTEENLVVINKNAQVAIPRDQIDRIDARPIGRTRTITDTAAAQKDAATDPRSNIPGPNQPPGAMHQSSTTATSGVAWTKQGFETIYRRTAGSPPKK
ncbi:MAG TPA: hypothetical protein VMH28_30770 [Candidatus Acidoferrales bacterium]|nr:hypothetical protein [Candidatus Acidoferrales bacterium]